MLEPVKNRNDKLGPKVVNALKKRHFEAYYFSTKEEAVEKILDMIPTSDIISWGGTMTVDQLELKQKLVKKGCSVIDRDTASSPAEKQDLMRKALTCDNFLMSSNAITEDGELFNIDGVGNRVAALCYGPKNVFVIAGMNKIVKDMPAAYSRVRNYAAPANTQRFSLDIPCIKTGACENCISSQSCCCQFVETRICRPEGRIKVFLIGEDLGL